MHAFRDRVRVGGRDRRRGQCAVGRSRVLSPCTVFVSGCEVRGRQARRRLTPVGRRVGTNIGYWSVSYCHGNSDEDAGAGAADDEADGGASPSSSATSALSVLPIYYSSSSYAIAAAAPARLLSSCGGVSSLYSSTSTVTKSCAGNSWNHPRILLLLLLL